MVQKAQTVRQCQNLALTIGSDFAGMYVTGTRELWMLVPRFQKTAEARQCEAELSSSKETPRGPTQGYGDKSLVETVGY